MSWWNVFVSLPIFYLLIGSILAFVNFCTTEERKKLVEKLNDLRRGAFQKGIDFQIQMPDNLQEIGLDEDTAVQNSPTLRSPELASLSVFGVRIIVALAIALLGPIYLTVILRERRALRRLRLIYKQAAEAYSVSLKNSQASWAP